MSGSEGDLIDIDDDNLGFVKLFRKILKWEWYTDVNVFKLFLHCLILANHAPKGWRGTMIETGQFISSLDHLAKGAGLSVREVRTALGKLERTNEVTRKATNSFSMITINNYSTYHEKGNQSDKLSDKRETNERQTSDKRATTTKKTKNTKKTKKEKKKEGENVELIYPDCIERALIDKYFQNRIDIKKEMTHNAKELFLKKVQKFHDKGQDIKTLIEKAIIAGWSDIYEANDYGKRKDYPGSKQIPVKKAGTKSERKREFVPGLKTTITIIDKKGKHQRGQENGFEVIKH